MGNNNIIMLFDPAEPGPVISTHARGRSGGKVVFGVNGPSEP